MLALYIWPWCEAPFSRNQDGQYAHATMQHVSPKSNPPFCQSRVQVCLWQDRMFQSEMNDVYAAAIVSMIHATLQAVFASR